MKPESPAPPQATQRPTLQLVERTEASPRSNSRRRASDLHRGSLDRLDAAIEARRDTEQVSKEFELRRPDAQDEYASRTRRLVRQLQGDVRELRRELGELRRAA